MIHFTSTDHKAVISTFKTDNFVRGKGVWIFNESLLFNQDFCKNMSDFIKNYYNELIEDQIFTNQEIWDLLKIGIRDECISFSRNSKRKLLLQDNIDNELFDLSSDLASSPNDIDLINKLALLSSKKELLELERSNGAIKRAKLVNIQEGERNSALFLSLEQTKQSQQIIREVYDRDGQIVNTPGGILSEISSFYKSLMNVDLSNDDTNLDHNMFLDNFLEGTDYPILSEEEKLSLESPISINELSSALKLLNSDSSPGCDGLSSAFYSSFWNELKSPLLKIIH